MTFLPIVARELRVASRKSGTYWSRWAAALAGLGAGVWIYAMTSREAPKETGMVLFVTLTVLGNLYAVLSGLRTTSDCISEEKREGTLGLLFLTDLKGYDIVLGKLAATSLNAFYALLAMFPIMGICLLMGGVTPGEFGRITLVSINNLLFSLAVGMFCSSISRDARKAATATFLMVAIAALLPPIGMALAELRGWKGLLPLFLLPSPSYSCFAAFEVTARVPAPVGFLPALASVHALSWVFLALACLIVPRTWQDRLGRSRSVGKREGPGQWLYGSGEFRLAVRRRLLEINPVYWLCYRERHKQGLVFSCLGFLLLLWVWGALKLDRDWMEGAAIPTVLILHTMLKIWISNEACRRFCEDRRSSAIELLLATPMSVPEIVRGQRLALWRQFGAPTLTVLGADFVLMFLFLGFMRSDQGYWTAVWGVGMAIMAWDMHALSWVAPWMGLNSKNPNRASGAALTRICVLPWVAFGLILSVVGMLEVFYRFNLNGRFIGGLLIFLWFAISAVNNIAFTSWSKNRLMNAFRELATQRFDSAARPGAWGRVLGLWFAGPTRAAPGKSGS